MLFYITKIFVFAGTDVIFCFIGCRALKCSCRFCWNLSSFLLEALFDFASTDHWTATRGKDVAFRFLLLGTLTRGELECYHGHHRKLDPANCFATTNSFLLEIAPNFCFHHVLFFAGSSFFFFFHHDGDRQRRRRPVGRAVTGERAGGASRPGASLIHGHGMKVFCKRKDV